MFTKQAVGAFIAGGVLVGGITLAMGVAGGTGTATTSAGTTSAGESSAQYTAKHAWVATAQNSVTTTLPIPAGERLTIISVFTVTGQLSGCTLNASLNGTAFTLTDLSEDVEGGTPTPTQFQPFSLDSGTMTCPFAAMVVGYLTPIPAG